MLAVNCKQHARERVLILIGSVRAGTDREPLGRIAFVRTDGSTSLTCGAYVVYFALPGLAKPATTTLFAAYIHMLPTFPPDSDHAGGG